MFNAYDNPLPEGRVTAVLDPETVRSIKVCVQSPETSRVGELLEPHQEPAWWQFHVHRWTGLDWSGEVRVAECGPGQPEDSWIHVRTAEGSEIRPTAAWAISHYHDGEWVSGEIVFSPEPANPEAHRPVDFEGILAHELGHIMGFSHVRADWPSWIMQVPTVRPWPEDESRHAQLAYQVGRNVLYPGLTPPASLSNDATLRVLEAIGLPYDHDVDTGGFVYPLGLVPPFDPAVLNYRTTALHDDVASLRVTGWVNELNATVTINGEAGGRRMESDPIELEAGGETKIEVAVTAQDRTTTLTYTLTVGPAGPTANRPPEPVGGLVPLTVRLDESAVSVDVSGAFRDPDGDALTYGATSSSPAVAAVSVSGSTVTVTPVGEGTTTVTVTATDIGGSNTTATLAFRVTVERVPATTFTDDPILPGVTPIKAVHFTELRERIDLLRDVAGLAPFGWTDLILTADVTPVRLSHLLELREALAAAYRASGRAGPVFTDVAPMSGTTPIRAVHLTELRAAVVALQ